MKFRAASKIIPCRVEINFVPHRKSFRAASEIIPCRIGIK